MVASSYATATAAPAATFTPAAAPTPAATPAAAPTVAVVRATATAGCAPPHSLPIPLDWDCSQ
jgi:hypothetical protein